MKKLAIDRFFSAQLNPLRWGWTHYLSVAIFLLLVNLLGPRGLVQFVLLHQEKQRLDVELVQIDREIKSIKKEIHRFEISKTVKEKFLRDHLGLLAENEFFVELVKEK